ncbi:MAG: hypothetical protein O4861_08970 [Trichodesmium sp. St16_bin4-tuft]|nr:hypothetical protein [Trichodesmium sp. St5_bin8]MDE5098456.1 hypothetical protein [Trichodesmium sp. St16_bin4-tuft]MDE5102682.1 hypothetical protein [Trichodesmium sp. St19_bin2]
MHNQVMQPLFGQTSSAFQLIVRHFLRDDEHYPQHLKNHSHPSQTPKNLILKIRIEEAANFEDYK